MEEGYAAGGVDVGGCSRDSGRYSEDGSGRDECEMGTMPSGVDCRLGGPLKAKCADAGLWRAVGMVMAEDMRMYCGFGEREAALCSPLTSSEASKYGVETYVMVGEAANAGRIEA
jgi:hypothetical protein